MLSSLRERNRRWEVAGAFIAEYHELLGRFYDVRNQLTIKGVEADQLVQDKLRLETEVNKATAQMLVSDSVDFAKEISSLNAIIRTLERQLKEKSRSDRDDALLGEILGEKRLLEQETKRLKERVDSLGDQLSAMTANRDELESQNLRLSGELEASIAEADAKGDRLVGLEAENAELVELIITTKQEVADQLNAVQALYSSLQQKHRSDQLLAAAATLSDSDRAALQSFFTAGDTMDGSVSGMIRKWAAHEAEAHALCHSSIGLISAGGDNVLRVWDQRTAERRVECRGASRDMVCVHCCGETIVGGSADSGIRIFNRQGVLTKTLLGHSNRVNGLHIGSRFIISGSADRTVKLWDRGRGRCEHTALVMSSVNCLDVSSNAHFIVSGHVDGKIRLLDPRTLSTVFEPTHRIHSGHVVSTLFTPSGDVVSVGRDNSVRLFDVRALQERSVLRPEALAVPPYGKAAISPNGKIVAVGSATGTVYLLDIQSGRTLRQLDGRTAAVLACAFDSTGTTLYTADKLGTIVEWQ